MSTEYRLHIEIKLLATRNGIEGETDFKEAPQMRKALGKFNYSAYSDKANLS
jgi:hypothetical protein